MSEPSKAVFLSYASQDADAAKRIADALHGAGVEVWFDAEGGLEHGDAWDAKIRRQIKECVLFIPIISANTQEREEGYFRLEWDLAAERSRTIATGVAFILPVLVDATREPEALVPDRFRTVQWTKLPGGVVPPEVLQRFLKLWSHRTGALKGVEAGRPRPAEEEQRSGGTPPPTNFRRRVFVGGVLALVAVVGAWFALRPAPPAPISNLKSQIPNAPAPAANAANPATPARTDFPKDPDLAKAIALTETLNSTVEDHALAEDLAKAVLARQPTDPETVIVNAYVENRFILRGFDLSEERYATARRLCERALLLAPDHPEALHVLGQFLVFRQADLPRAVDLLRRAVTLQPGQARFYNSYIEALGAIKAPETVQVAEAAAARFPDDPIIHYRLALTYAFEAGRLDAYEKALKETIAIGPVATALIRLSTIMMIVHHDIPAARAWLDRVPAAFRLNDRTVFARYMLASASGEPADVENALRLLSALPGNFLNDFGLLPKQMLIGDLYARVGNEVVARRGYEAALVDIAQEQARNPQLKFERVRKLILLGLGRKAEARETVNLTYATAARPFTLVGVSNTWFNTITTLLLLDERAKAVELLREAVKEEWGRRILAGTFAVDPHLAPWREDAEIQALLADPAATPSAMPAVDQKSVAVLAFANLSDDKANEYFSDGISEELLNVLAKVPGLKVSARTSAFFFKGKEVPIPEIARQLGVAYVVEGSVRKQGDKVRITAQLIKAADGFHVWSDTFTRDLKDIFAVQDEIAGLVARNLEAKLGAATRPEARVDARVLELYMQGRVAWNRRNTEGFDRAEALFREALAIAPDFARAHAALGDVWMIRAISDGNLSLYGQRSASVIPPIEAEVQRALELDPESAEAHATLGFLRQLQHRPDEALRLLRRSVELNPNYATGHHWLAGILAYGSWFEESIAEYRRAVAVDPLSPRILDNFGGTLLSLGRLHEALTFFDRALILQPDEPQALAHRAIALARLGRRDEARALAGKISKGNRLSFLLATGDRAELETALTGATRSERFYLLSALGRPDEALNYFSSDDIVLEDTQDWLFDHNLVPFYHDPRFRKVITELGFDDYLTRALAWQAANPAAKK